MARRRTKKRTHVGSKNGSTTQVVPMKSSNTPKSMVIRIGAGDVGPSVSQLSKDVRQMVGPDTAARLKERRANKLKDYLAMSGPLGVTHLILFSRSESGNTNLRIAITPRGPTLHFHVEKYSLCKDVKRSLRHPKGCGKEFITAPLLVMNNFTSPSEETNSESKIPKHLESLVTSIFQSLFQPISSQSTPLSSIKRVMLLDREILASNNQKYILNLRHYAITTRVTGLSKPMKRLDAAKKFIKSRKVKKSKNNGLPKLGKFKDIADYVTGENQEGYMSDMTSESENDSGAEVEVAEVRAKKIMPKQQKERKNKGEKGEYTSRHVEKRVVKLTELGPRMRLRMIKVEEGVCDGKIMWHEYFHKTKEEIKELDRRWEQRRQEKEERKRIQRENIERKKKELMTKSSNKEGNDHEMDLNPDEWDSDDFED